MARSMLARALAWEMRSRWRSHAKHAHQLTSAQHQSLRALQPGIGQGLDASAPARGAGAARARRPRACKHQAGLSWPAHPWHGQSPTPCGLTTATSNPSACNAQAASNSQPPLICELSCLAPMTFLQPFGLQKDDLPPAPSVLMRDQRPRGKPSYGGRPKLSRQSTTVER